LNKGTIQMLYRLRNPQADGFSVRKFIPKHYSP